MGADSNYKCSQSPGNVYQWNAAQCVAVMDVTFQNDPVLKSGATVGEKKQAVEEWGQLKAFLVVHLGVFGAENILKALGVKYLRWSDKHIKDTFRHDMSEMFRRLPTQLKVSWHNRYLDLYQRNDSVPTLEAVLTQHRSTYTTVRYEPHHYVSTIRDLGLDIFTYHKIIRAGLEIFASDACYCPGRSC